MTKKIVFFLLGKKGLETLNHVLHSIPLVSHSIEYVVIGRDKKVQNDYSNELINLCNSYKIEYHERSKILNVFDAKYGIAIGWRWLININSIKLIVLHDSLLPKYRGFNPLVTALMRGDKEIGVTAFIADDGIDTGEIIKSKSVIITYPIKIENAINILSELYAKLVEEVITDIVNESLTHFKQNEEFATYSIWRNEEDYFIDWNSTAEDIKKFVDSTGYPYLGACTYYDDILIRVKEVDVLDDLEIVNRVPGKIFQILDNQPTVICGKGLVKITEAVDNNGKAVTFNKLRIKLKNENSI